MQNLPNAEVYTQEMQHMPWGNLIHQIKNSLTLSLPKGSRVLDMMCGPGYFINQLLDSRPDLKCTGVDLDEGFIEYAVQHNPKATFIVADALKWRPARKFDVVICTGGIHHVPDYNQQSLIGKLASFAKQRGRVITADPCIDNFSSLETRRLAAAKLGHEYLRAAIKSDDVPMEVLDAAVQILRNDVLMIEWKTSLENMQFMLGQHFKRFETYKTWPEGGVKYGDYFFVMKK